MLEARILQAQGYTQMQIAEELGVTDRTVRTYLKARPCARKKPVRPSKLDPFKAFLEQQLEKTLRTTASFCTNGSLPKATVVRKLL